MKRWRVLLGLVLVLVWSTLAAAQNQTGQAYTHGQITVSTTAVPITAALITPTGQQAATSCVLTVDSGAIHLRWSGGDATTSDHLAATGTAISVVGAGNLALVSMIRDGGSDATVNATCARGNALAPPPVSITPGVSVGDIMVGDLMVGAQPADDPHFVRCSDGTTANPCVVSGTVTANLGATDNAVLDDIADGIPISTALPAGTNNIGDVDVLSSALPTGAATSDAQGTGNTSLASIDGKLPALDSGRIPVVLPAGGSGLTDAELRADPVPVTCGDCSGSGVTHQDDAAFTGGTDDVVPTGALFDATPPTITDGRVGAFRMSADRYLYAIFPTAQAITGTLTAVTAITNALPAGTNTVGAMRLRDSAGDEVTDATANAVRHLAVDSTGTAIPLADTGNGAAGAATTRVAVSDKGANTASNAVPVVLSTDRSPCSDASQVVSVPISTATSGNVQLVAISGSTIVYVCGFDVTSAADVNVQFITGTGTACATGETDKTGTYQLTAASGAGMRGIVRPNGGAVQFKSAAGEAACVELSGAVQIDGLFTYVQR